VWASLSRSAEVNASQRAGSMMASVDVQNALVASAKVLVPASSATTARSDDRQRLRRSPLRHPSTVQLHRHPLARWSGFQVSLSGYLGVR
jgi:hypothetical protein